MWSYEKHTKFTGTQKKKIQIQTAVTALSVVKVVNNFS